MLSSAVILALGALATTPSAPQSDVRSMFETPSQITVSPGGMLVATAPTHMVALARVAADGSIVIVCVESDEGAQNFLHKQQTIETHKAQEK